MMDEDFKELNDMISLDREEVRQEKEICQKYITKYLDDLKSYHINNVDISSHYDLENDYNKYKIDDTYTRYNLNKEMIDYKIEILQRYLQDLKLEQRFLEFKLKKELDLTDNEHKEYLSNPVVRHEKVSKWFDEFYEK